MEDFLVADMIYCTKTIPKPRFLSKLNFTGPCRAPPWKGFLSQDDYLCEVSLWSHWVHLGLAQANPAGTKNCDVSTTQKNREIKPRKLCLYSLLIFHMLIHGRQSVADVSRSNDISHIICLWKP
jgi:hypothetical protein